MHSCKDSSPHWNEELHKNWQRGSLRFRLSSSSMNLGKKALLLGMVPYILVKVHHLSDAIQPVGENLDQSLLRYLTQLGWSRFRTRQSILALQQVTPGLPSSTA